MNWRPLLLCTVFMTIISVFFIGRVSSTETTQEQINIANQISIDQPAIMENGYNQARRIFIDENSLDVPLNWSWNYLPQKPTEAIGNWLVYGGIGEETEQFMIGVQFEGQTSLRYDGLRSALSRLKIFRNKKIELLFVGRDQKIDTQHGILNTVHFGYKHNGVTKGCLGYMSEPSSIKLKGFYCAKKATPKWGDKLTCLINTLKIYDEPYWREPEKVKNESAACPLNEATKNKI